MASTQLTYLVKSSKEAMSRGREYSQEAIKLIDKVLVWIIGFATGLIGLLLTQSSSLKVYSEQDIKIIVTVLIISILIGILARVMNAISQYLSIRVLTQLHSKLDALDSPFSPRILNGNESAEEINSFFMEDFGIEVIIISDLIPINTKPDSKAALDKSARDYYVYYKEWVGGQLKEAMEKILNTVKETYFFSDSKMKRIANYPEWVPKTMRFTFNISLLFYFVTVVLFATGLLLMVCKYFPTT